MQQAKQHPNQPASLSGGGKAQLPRADWAGPYVTPPLGEETLGITHVIGHPGVDKVTQEFHDAAVCVPMVQGGGGDGPLQDGNDHLAAEQGDWAALDEPGQGRERSGRDQ